MAAQRAGLTQALGRTRIRSQTESRPSERTHPHCHPHVLPCNCTRRASANRTGARDQATATHLDRREQRRSVGAALSRCAHIHAAWLHCFRHSNLPCLVGMALSVRLVATQPWSAVCGLTIRSSRDRFAARLSAVTCTTPPCRAAVRLNSGVRRQWKELCRFKYSQVSPSRWT